MENRNLLDIALIRKIYNRIVDEVSKELFINRLLYSLTEDKKYIHRVIGSTEEGKKLQGAIKSKDVLIFGAGTWGKDIASTYGISNFKAFIDNNCKKKQCLDIPVYRLEEYLEKSKDELILISSRLYYKEMYEQLMEAGIPKERIINAGKWIDQMSKRQYFDLEEMRKKQTEKEVFVDAGCFDGKTTLEFIHWCNNNYRKIYGFEPDVSNYDKCIALLENQIKEKKCKIISKGVWDKAETIRFHSLSNGASVISQEGDSVIHTTTIDGEINEKVTFIKMDLEGAEYNALLGAGRQIEHNKPKLAISVYHNPEDIWKLPELILQMNENYNLFFRHYSVGEAETVLYAI